MAMKNKKNKAQFSPENIENTELNNEVIVNEEEFISEDFNSEPKIAEEEAVSDTEVSDENNGNDDVPEKAESDQSIANEAEPQEVDELSGKYLCRLVITLMLICTCVAFMLAFVNNITKDIIAENKAAEVRAAIMKVFPDCDRTEEFTAADGSVVYIAVKNDTITGYCVNAAGSGYNGDVGFMIGIDTDHTLSGIRIVSISETPGVGTKIQSDSFLSQFLGLKEPAVLGEILAGV